MTFSDVSADNATATLKDWLKYSPVNVPQGSPDLRGFWIKTQDGLIYLCEKCAGRIIGRGCGLPVDSEPVWKDRPEPYGVCVCCEK